MLRGWRHDRLVTLCAFDLIEIDGTDLRCEPLERRKALLAQLVRKPLPGLVPNATFAEPGDVVFKHACALGCERIVSKRLGIAVSLGTPARLAQVEEPECARGARRRRNGLKIVEQT